MGVTNGERKPGDSGTGNSGLKVIRASLWPLQGTNMIANQIQGCASLTLGFLLVAPLGL